MKTINLRDAKAGLSSLVDDVMKGETVEITRHGKPVAALVPIEAARRLSGENQRENFGKFLMSFPGGVEIERDQSPMREVEL